MSARRNIKAVTAAQVIEAQNLQARQAYLLRQQGKSWWDIAEALGISERTAQIRVDEAISVAASMVDEFAKRSLLAMEVGRMDALQDAFWATAIGGDVKAAELVLKISAQRSKLLGLDVIADPSSLTHHTVIVSGTSAEYIAALQGAGAVRAGDE